MARTIDFWRASVALEGAKQSIFPETNPKSSYIDNRAYELMERMETQISSEVQRRQDSTHTGELSSDAILKKE
jgi:hypothetical protein